MSEKPKSSVIISTLFGREAAKRVAGKGGEGQGKGVENEGTHGGRAERKALSLRGMRSEQQGARECNR
jgi:hypothetical protein